MTVTGARVPGPGERSDAGGVGARPFLRGVSTLGGGRLVGAGISAVWLLVAARQLSVAEFGDLSVLLSIGLIAAVFGDLGYPFLLSHEVAAAGAVSVPTLRSVITSRLAVGVLVAAATAVLYLAVASDTDPAIPMVFAVSLLSTVVYSSISAALRGLGLYRFEALNEIASRAFVLVVGAMSLRAGGGLLAAVAVYAAADFVSMVVLVAVALRRCSAGDDGIDRASLRLRHNRHLGASRLVSVVYYRSDSWLMAALRGPVDAALYAAPYRLLDGLLLLPRAIGAVAVPHLQRHVSVRDARRLTVSTAVGAACVAVPIAAFARPIIELVFGQRYSSSAAVLAVLACSAIPGALINAAGPLAALRTPKTSARLMMGALVASIAFDLFAIPRWGPIGAAAVTLGCQTAVAVPIVALLCSSAVRRRALR